MGTLVDKGKYLNDTKLAIRDAIVSKGEEITDKTTFREYADKINNIRSTTEVLKNLLYLGGGSIFTPMSRELVSLEDVDFLFSLLNTSKMTSFKGLFYGVTNLVRGPLMDTTSAHSWAEIFENCINLEQIPPYNLSGVDSLEGAFIGTKIKTIPLLNTINLVSFNSCFKNCKALTEIPEINTSKVKTSISTFEGCSNLKSLPNLDLGKSLNFGNFVKNCTSLTELPSFNYSESLNCTDMCNGCTNLQHVGAMNTGKTTVFNRTFLNNTNLKKIDEIDFASITVNNDMFTGCPNLAFLRIKNLGKSSKNVFDFSALESWGDDSIEPGSLQSLLDTFNLPEPLASPCTVTFNSAVSLRIPKQKLEEWELKGFTFNFANIQ